MTAAVSLYELFDAPAPKLAPLHLDEELAAIEAANAGDKAAYNRLTRAYIPAIRGAVQREYRALRDTHSLDEVRAIVLLAFAEAVADPFPGARVAATFKGQVFDAVHKHANPTAAVSIPTRTYSRFVQILDAADGDPTRAEELAPSMGMTVEVLRSIRDARGMWHSLDATVDAWNDADGIASRQHRPSYSPSGSGADDGEPATYAIGIERGYASVDQADDARRAFAAMDDDERAICKLAYGFDDYEPLPDAEVGHRLGMSRATARRRRMHALEVAHAAICDGHEGRCNRPHDEAEEAAA